MSIQPSASTTAYEINNLLEYQTLPIEKEPARLAQVLEATVGHRRIDRPGIAACSITPKLATLCSQLASMNPAVQGLFFKPEGSGNDEDCRFVPMNEIYTLAPV